MLKVKRGYFRVKRDSPVPFSQDVDLLPFALKNSFWASIPGTIVAQQYTGAIEEVEDGYYVIGAVGDDGNLQAFSYYERDSDLGERFDLFRYFRGAYFDAVAAFAVRRNNDTVGLFVDNYSRYVRLASSDFVKVFRIHFLADLDDYERWAFKYD